MGGIQDFGKFRLYTIIATISIYIGRYFSGIVEGIKESMQQTGTAKLTPLFHALIGNLLVIDRSIIQNIELIKSGVNPARVVELAKTDIIIIILLWLLIVYGIYWVIKRLIFGWVQSDTEQKGHIGRNVLYVSFALGVLWIFGMIYAGRYYDDWSVIPFKGIVELVRNMDIWAMSGVEAVSNGVNNTIGV